MLAGSSCLALVAVLITQPSPSKLASPASAPISTTTMNGQPVSATQVTVIANGYESIPEIVYANNGQDDPTLDQQLITKGLASTADLRSWELCSTVLTQAAIVASSEANIMFADPQDPPFDNGPSLKAVPVYYQQAVSDQAWAKVFRQAAKLANNARIPCFDPHLPLNKAHWVTMTGRDSAGVQHVLIPDDAVIGGAVRPVELMYLNHDCWASLVRELHGNEAAKLDTHVAAHNARLNTFDAWAKADNTVFLKASIAIAIATGVPCGK